jgi:hypothetical protein
MNMGQRKRRILISLGLLMTLVMTSGGAAGTLLCFGRDGHVTIEFAGLCDSAKEQFSFAGEEQNDGCGPCADVSFPDRNVIAQKVISPSLIFAISATTIFLFTPFLNVPVVFAFRGTSLPFRNTLAALKSIVLLI